MTVLMVRYEVAPSRRDAFEAAVATLMAALEREHPDGIRYALCGLPDGRGIVGFLVLGDGVDNPLPGIPEARRFQEGLTGWVDGDPTPPVRLEVLGSYRLVTEGQA